VPARRRHRLQRRHAGPDALDVLGATYILHEKFDPEAVIADIEKEKVTHIVMVPAQIVAILNSPAFDPDKLASLEMIHNVGAPLLLEYKHRLNESLPGRFYELYGLTEGFMTVLDKHDAIRKVGSVGVPAPFMEMRILDADGRSAPRRDRRDLRQEPHDDARLLQAAGPDRKGHRRRLAAHRGCRLRGRGRVFFLVDRIKDMIISGGVNVYPKDIEEIVIQYPDISEVAVSGFPTKNGARCPSPPWYPCPAPKLTPGT
jgi:long-chain acyl-CoA synthetase